MYGNIPGGEGDLRLLLTVTADAGDMPISITHPPPPNTGGWGRQEGKAG